MFFACDRIIMEIPSLQKMAIRSLFTASLSKNYELGGLEDFHNLYVWYREQCLLQIAIEQIVSDFGGYIFGGYVRDKIAGIVPKNIDIRFHYRMDINEFFLRLTQQFNVSLLDKPGVHIMVIDRNALDRFVYLNITNEQDHGKLQQDFDVNTLLLKHDRIVYPLGCDSLQEQLRLQRACVKKEMIMSNGNGLFTERHYDHTDCIDRETLLGRNMLYSIRKFEDKGWIIRGKGKCDNVRCVLSNDIMWETYVREG